MQKQERFQQDEILEIYQKIKSIDKHKLQQTTEKTEITVESAQFYDNYLLASLSNKQISESAMQDSLQEEADLYGYLYKQKQGMIRSWEKFNCVLSKNQLSFHPNELRTELVCHIDFQLLDCCVKHEQQAIVLIFQYGFTITLRAQSRDQTYKWSRAIRKCIRRTQKIKKPKIKPDKFKVYFQQQLVTEAQLRAHSKTGDILLMRTAASGCAFQRMMTDSEYDHIGMIVRFRDGSLKVFEANNCEGVALYEWSQYMLNFPLYEKICYRRLSYESEEMHEQIVKFIKETLGNEYQLGLFKIMRHKSNDVSTEERSFFCSELVAKAYKEVGLIEGELASSRYWPVDFTKKGGLKLKGDVHLGRQCLILLRHHLIEE